MNPTIAQHKTLVKAGWMLLPGDFCKCHVCHLGINCAYGYFSPGNAAYHEHCVMDAPQVKRLFKRVSKDKAS